MGDLFSNQTELPWLNSYEKSWKKITQNNKTPHAILISGNSGIGKRSFAIWLASKHLDITTNGSRMQGKVLKWLNLFRSCVDSNCSPFKKKHHGR